MKKGIVLSLLLLLSVTAGWGQAIMYVTGTFHSNAWWASPAGCFYRLEVWDTSYTTLLSSSHGVADQNGYYIIGYPYNNADPQRGRIVVQDCRGALHYHQFDIDHVHNVTHGLDLWIGPDTVVDKAGFTTELPIGVPTGITFYDYSVVGDDAVTQWNWDFGDGQTIQATPPFVHTYPSVGTYYACVNVVTQSGRNFTFCDSVAPGTPRGNPVANLTYEPMGEYGKGFKVRSNYFRAPVSYLYKVLDTVIFERAVDSLPFNYAAAGTDSARVWVFYSDGASVSVPLVFTHGGSDFEARYSQMQDTTQQYSLLLQDESQGNAIDYYFWDFGDGDTSNLQYPTHTYAGPGTYRVCQSVLDLPMSCISTFCDSIVVVNKVNAPFTIQVVPSTAASVEEIYSPSVTLNCHPNPAHDRLTVSFSLAASAQVGLQILDLQGRQLMDVPAARYAGGQHEIDLSIGDLLGGVYFVRIQAGGQQVVKKLMVGR